MSRLAWHGPVFRLELAYPSVALHRAPSRYARELSDPVAVAQLDHTDFDKQMRALAEYVRKMRARLDVVLPEAEVWRGAHKLAGSDDLRKRQGQAAAAAAQDADPEALVVVLGQIDAEGRTPLAAVRRDTLAQARGFLAQFGLRADTITGAGRFPGFTAPPRLDGLAARSVRAKTPRTPTNTGLAHGRQIVARLLPKIVRAKERLHEGAGWFGAAFLRVKGRAAQVPAIRTASVLHRRAAAAAVALVALMLLGWAIWPSATPDQAVPVAVVTPAPTVSLPATGRSAPPTRADAEIRRTVVRDTAPAEPDPQLARVTRFSPRPLPAPDPRPVLASPALATSGASVPAPEAGDPGRSADGDLPPSAPGTASAPPLAMPGAVGRTPLSQGVTFGTRNLPARALAASQAPRFETPAERVLAQVVEASPPLPADPPRVAVLANGPRPRPGQPQILSDAGPAASAPGAVQKAPVRGVFARPMQRPVFSQIALTEAIDGAVRLAAITAPPAPRMDRPVRRSFAAPREAVRDLPAAAPVRTAAPVQQVGAAPQIVRAPNPVTRMVQRITTPVRSVATARQAASNLSLIGIFGKSDARYALVRLPDAGIARVRRGDSVQGQQVAAVSGDGIVLRGRGGDVTLRLPD